MIQFTTILIGIICSIRISTGLYIMFGSELQHNITDDLSEFQNQLGLTNRKVELSPSQKDQRDNGYSNDDKPQTRIEDIITYVHQHMKRSERTLKTSLNFEVASTSEKHSQRHRRKIAVKMVSEMPSDRVDDLLHMFNEKLGIGSYDVDDDDDDYSDFPIKVPSATDPDYMYENLYEDEVDLAIPAKSRHNSEYGSFQDLIIQASRSQWQRNIDETKLRAPDSKHFI